MDDEDEVKIVKVKVLDPALKSYGPYRYEELSKAQKGEEKGIWQIVRDNQPSRTYETRVMTARNGQTTLGSLTYETKAKSTAQKKTRVAWVMDSSIMGGAEMSCQEVIRVGIDCGFDISVITPTAFHVPDLEADLIVLNNLFSFEQSQIRAILEGIYCRRIPYVKYEHDHREIARAREFSRRLFQGSRLNVFLSPMHLENHRKALGCEGICLPLAIDVDMFKPVPGVERKTNTALVCNVRNFKTWNKLQDYITTHPEIEFTVLHNNEPAVSGPNVKAKPMFKVDEMPALYSEYEFLVHLMDELGAGERVIFEAALCGCRVVSDDHAGHMSWGMNLEDTEGLRRKLKQAPFEFWKAVDEVM
jgi:hypothetical protein